MREVKGWNKEEQEELKKLLNGRRLLGVLDDMRIIAFIVNGEANRSLYEKWHNSTTKERNQMAQDIIDLTTGKAKFQDPKKYYVQFVNDGASYLNKNTTFDYSDVTDAFFTNSEAESENYQTQFTLDEIKAIDERYLPFAVPVE